MKQSDEEFLKALKLRIKESQSNVVYYGAQKELPAYARFGELTERDCDHALATAKMDIRILELACRGFEAEISSIINVKT